MEKQHLTYFKIENFKRFDSFEMNNLGQFNLIVGDNNVGKTSALEALLFDEGATKLIGNYFYTFLNRNYSISKSSRLDNLTIDKISPNNFWQAIFKDTSKPIVFYVSPDTPFFKIAFSHLDSLNKEDRDEIRKTTLGVIPEYASKNSGSGSGSGSGLTVTAEYWLKMSYSYSGFFQIVPAFFDNREIYQVDTPFMPANLSYDDDLVTYFYKFFNEQKSVRRELEKNLQLLIPNLEEIRIHRFYGDRDMIALSLKDDDSLQPLTRYGDGTVKVVRLLMEVILNRSNRLMVDEMGSGIHFTRLKDYWKTVIQLCAKYNVPPFATTHSLECQQAFVEALEDSELQQYQKDARNISLIENKQGEVKAVTYDFSQFEYALNIGFNTRGGKA